MILLVAEVISLKQFGLRSGRTSFPKRILSEKPCVCKIQILPRAVPQRPADGTVCPAIVRNFG